MKSITARIKSIEERVTPVDDNDYSPIGELCEAVLAMIEAGEIVDWTGDNAERFLSPSTVPGLQEPRYAEVWGVKSYVEELVGQYALATGWRSTICPAGWRSYRANSADELAAVAKSILKFSNEVTQDEN